VPAVTCANKGFQQAPAANAGGKRVSMNVAGWPFEKK